MAEFGTDEWLSTARVELAGRPCYRCGRVGTMTLGWELTVVDPHLLSGSTLKVSALRELYAGCPACDWRARLTPDPGED